MPAPADSHPASEEDAHDNAITATLGKVNLCDIFARAGGDLNKVIDWTNVLSLGEQQRVTFARLFLKSPAIAFLDEENELFLYEKLRASGIAYVGVGHRSTLKNDGTSALAPLPKPAAERVPQS